jgi:hypothetical protein
LVAFNANVEVWVSSTFDVCGELSTRLLFFYSIQRNRHLLFGFIPTDSNVKPFVHWNAKMKYFSEFILVYKDVYTTNERHRSERHQ